MSFFSQNRNIISNMLIKYSQPRIFRFAFYLKTPRKLNRSQFSCNAFLKDYLTEWSWTKRSYFYNQVNSMKFGYCTDAINEKSKENGVEFDSNKTSLFPEARVTLNALSNRLSEKLCDVYFKQNKISIKGAKNKIKSGIPGDWTCTLLIYWPEKKIFESTSATKKKSAEESARKALTHLYNINKINKNGEPIYSKKLLENVQKEFNFPYKICMDSHVMKEVEDIVSEYENGIKSEYEKAHNKVLKMMYNKPYDHITDVANEDVIADVDEIPNQIDSKSNILSETIQPNLHPVNGQPFRKVSEQKLLQIDEKMTRKFENFAQTRTCYLPIDDYISELQSCKNRVCIITGGPGCGKSTRAPLYYALSVHKSKANIIVTEPRRVAAISLAENVSEDLGEEVGETVGYQVRLDAKLPRRYSGSILYCTSGILLRKLQANPGLIGCSHVFLDEAHERDINTDLILMLLRRSMDLNPDLNVVIMSATMNIDVFRSYFENPAVIEIPGKAFDVKNLYLEDVENCLNIEMSNARKNCETADNRTYINCTEITDAILAIDKREPEGAILVFLPGWAEIRNVRSILNERLDDSSLHVILPVHSRLSSEEQKKVFHKFPLGTRKIILSTNISECSLTIKDVVCVIDSGAHKQNNINQNTGSFSLETLWISKASAKQRAGRAGRVQEGTCYKLYTRDRENAFTDFDIPEIKRVSLDKTILDCKILAPNEMSSELFSKLPEPPSSESIENALNYLKDVGCLTKSEQLTSLGAAVTCLTMQVASCISILHAAMFSCASRTVACTVLSESGVKIFNFSDNNEEIRSTKSKFHPNSDHLSLQSIQQEYNTLVENTPELVDRFCEKYDFRREVLQNIRELSNLHLNQLYSTGVVKNQFDIDSNNDFDILVLLSLMCGYDKIGVPKTNVRIAGKLKTVTEYFDGAGVRIHVKPESVNYKNAEKNLLFYTRGIHSVERRAVVLDCTTSGITPLAVLLACGGDVVLEETSSVGDQEMALLKIVKHKIDIEIELRQAELLLKLKEIFKTTFVNFIESKCSEENKSFRYKFFNVLVKLLEIEISDLKRGYTRIMQKDVNLFDNK